MCRKNAWLLDLVEVVDCSISGAVTAVKGLLGIVNQKLLVAFLIHIGDIYIFPSSLISDQMKGKISAIPIPITASELAAPTLVESVASGSRCCSR